jgi:hypothetical protein
VRPARPPRGGSAALSRGCAAIRGLSPAPAWARMGCARPARRFDALRVRQERRSRTGFPDGGPPFAFAPPQRSVAALPHRPAGRTGTSDDASSPGLSCPTTHPGRWTRILDGSSGSRPACRVRGLVTPLAASTTVPPGASSAPERPRASPFKAFSSPRWVLLSESLPSCRSSRRFVAPHGERTDAPGFRASFPRRARAALALAGARVDAFLRFPPPGRSPSSSGLSLWSRSLPLHAMRRDVHGPLASWGLTESKRSAGPSRDCRPSWGLPPCDRRGAA